MRASLAPEDSEDTGNHRLAVRGRRLGILGHRTHLKAPSALRTRAEDALDLLALELLQALADDRTVAHGL